MTQKVGIRDVMRNFKILEQYDMVEIEDKKTKKLKGLFISERWAKELKESIEKLIEKKKQEDVDEIMKFSGMFDGEIGNLTSQEIKAKKREKYLK
jgi:DNA-binding transcriptional regulator YhcF (GntR family)